jgi:hypothetical protein
VNEPNPILPAAGKGARRPVGWGGRLLANRLLHFLLLGGLLYLVIPAPVVREPGVFISQRQVAALLTLEGRRLSQQSLPLARQREVISHFLENELLYREGLRQGLDRNDAIVRARVIQKMRLLIEETAAAGAAAGEEALRAFYQASPDRWQQPATISFDMVYLNPARHGAATEERALALLRRLQFQPETPWRRLGDPLTTAPQLNQATSRQIADRFGEPFAAALFALPAGTWQGPLASRLGWHLVRLREQNPARILPFEAVREEVLATLQREHFSRVLEGRVAELADRYQPVVAADPALVPALARPLEAVP